MSTSNWITVTESQFPWELEALDFVRQRFPQRDPYRAWSNFEFIADDGSVNEIDLLVLTPLGIYLIEIKSRPGVLRGDAGTWTWEHEGRQFTDDNPVISADRKAKKLRSLLERQQAIKKLKGRLPFIEVLAFCSAEQLQCNLTGNARYKVCLRDREATAEKPQRQGVMAALIAWAGYDHLQLTKAVSAFFAEVQQTGGSEDPRLVPLLGCILELNSWVKQWHNDVDPDFGYRLGDYFANFVEDEARTLGKTVADIRAWQPPEKTKKRKKKL